jgi:hypothetical protein
MEMLHGVLGFFAIAFVIFLVMEISVLFEELFTVRAQLRRGFVGSKSSVFKIFSRHTLRFLRMSETPRQNIGSGFKFIFIFLAAGLLPIWQAEAMLPVSHSLWIFIGLMLMGPVFYLVFEWVFKKGTGWPIVLIAAERTIGSATVLFILSITLVAMTGGDSFQEFQKIQSGKGWLIFHNPMAILLLIAFAVVNLFSSFQTIFARTGDEKQSGWSFNEMILPLRSSVWALFIADVFLGGADMDGFAGVFVLVFKCVGINLLSVIVSHLFFQLREDQAEAFILWRLGPLSILILALCLLFPGGVG